MQQDAPLSTIRSITRKPNPTTGSEPKRPFAAVTPRVKRAIEGMVWKGLGRKDAAEYAKMSESALYQAFRKPAVLAHYNAELEVLRNSARARNLQRLEEIRDQNDNYGAAVRAVQVLENMGEGASRPGVSIAVNITPGYVIDLSSPQVIDGASHRFDEPERSGPKSLSHKDDVGD